MRSGWLKECEGQRLPALDGENSLAKEVELVLLLDLAAEGVECDDGFLLLVIEKLV